MSLWLTLSWGQNFVAKNLPFPWGSNIGCANAYTCALGATAPECVCINSWWCLRFFLEGHNWDFPAADVGDGGGRGTAWAPCHHHGNEAKGNSSRCAAVKCWSYELGRKLLKVNEGFGRLLTTVTTRQLSNAGLAWWRRTKILFLGG